jgi:hypothetical protein
MLVIFFIYVICVFVFPCLQDFDLVETHGLVLTTVLRKSFNLYEYTYVVMNKNRGFEVEVENKIFFMGILLAFVSLSMTSGAARPKCA